MDGAVVMRKPIDPVKEIFDAFTIFPLVIGILAGAGFAMLGYFLLWMCGVL
jgi:hypothetical protein